MRLAIACSSLCLSFGGSERAAVNLANEMAARGHAVMLLSLPGNKRNAVPCYTVNPGIRHVPWNNTGSHEDIRLLRKFLLEDGIDVFLSMQSGRDHLFWAMACMGSGIPFICSERCDPVRYTEERVWNRPGRLAVLSGADVIHELLPSYVPTVPEVFRSKVKVIPNASPVVALPANAAGEQGKRLSLLYLARFDSQKRPKLLLDAFRLLASKYPDWDLIMWGHGPQEKALKAQICKWGMEERIQIRGICKDAPPVYAAAQIYCLPSAYEGFPNTVLEAMCAGLPVVGCAECDGIRDVVEHGKTGLVTRLSTPEVMAEALEPLMSNPVLRQAMGEAGKAAALAYAPSGIYSQWEALFEELVPRKGYTVMDSFTQEPFASKARLSAAARREWLYRNFGEPMPYSSTWFWHRCSMLCRRLPSALAAWGLNRLQALCKKTPQSKKEAL